jgi:hypothetical protein
MEFQLGLTLEETSLLRNSLDVIQIQGKSARMVAHLQDKFDEHIFQIQMNFQMAEEEKRQEEVQKIQQLEELAGEQINSSRGRKPKL